LRREAQKQDCEQCSKHRSVQPRRVRPGKRMMCCISLVADKAYTHERNTPPSTRNAAPFVADASGLHT
jgi:hypothetical protein